MEEANGRGAAGFLWGRSQGRGKGLVNVCPRNQSHRFISFFSPFIWQRLLFMHPQQQSYPRLLIAGSHSGAGKTSISLGLMAAFRQRGQSVMPYKVGPDYIDPAFHSFVTQNPSRNLDSWLLAEDTLQQLFTRHAPEEGGLAIIEGVMGFFDGLDDKHQGSSAHVAQLLAAPVILVINGAGLSRSAAALVFGFNNFYPGVKIAGVIINKVSGEKHYNLLKDIIESQAGVPCFGYLVKNETFNLESRHLGLIPSVEVKDLNKRLQSLAETLSETVDLDGLLKLAHDAPPLAGPAAPQIIKGAPVKIGVARDQAFNFYYEDNFELLQSLGAELHFISPLTAESFPDDLAGFYLGGGFPEVFAGELAKNQSFRQSLRQKLEQGLPCYAECGGLMYLSEAISNHEGQHFEMVGFFPFETEMTKRLQNFGYVEVEYLQDTILGTKGLRSRAHEFHHSRLVKDEGINYCLEMRKRDGRKWAGGVCREKTLAAYPHLHFYSQPQLAVNFVENCRKYKKS